MFTGNITEQEIISICINEYETAIKNCSEPIYMVPSIQHHSDFWEMLRKTNRHQLFEEKLQAFYWHASINISEQKPFNLQDRMILIGQRDKNSLFSCIPNDILSVIFQIKFKIILKHNEYIDKFYSTGAKKLMAELKASEELSILINRCNDIHGGIKLEYKMMENRFINKCSLF